MMEPILNEGLLFHIQFREKVRYIISKNTYAQTLLRKMLFYSGRGEILSNTLELSGDLFVWLISKVYGKREYHIKRK